MSVDVVGVVPSFTLGDRLRKAREFAELEQSELAARMGVSRATVSSAETGSRRVREITLKMWALSTGVNREWLETGQAPEGDPGPGTWYTTRDSNPEPADLEPQGRAEVIPFRAAA